MRYIVATDGSNASIKAARFLMEHSCPGAEDEIFVIYVFPLPTDPECYDGVVSLPTQASDERIARVAAPILENTVSVVCGTGSAVNEVVLVGNPAKEIVEF
ncbi:MAG: universal stress protein, partial [Acidobacteriota bacterium]